MTGSGFGFQAGGSAGGGGPPGPPGPTGPTGPTGPNGLMQSLITVPLGACSVAQTPHSGSNNDPLSTLWISKVWSPADFSITTLAAYLISGYQPGASVVLYLFSKFGACMATTKAFDPGGNGIVDEWVYTDAFEPSPATITITEREFYAALWCNIAGASFLGAPWGVPGSTVFLVPNQPDTLVNISTPPAIGGGPIYWIGATQ